jgi:hypothetical protein
MHYPKNLGAIATATYSASVVDCVTEDCLQADQQIIEDPRKWHAPEVLFQSIPQPAKSASKKLTRSSDEEVEYQIPNSSVYLRYLKIHWTDVWCEERGEVWKRAHRYTTNWMFGHVAVRYKRESIMLMYSLWSTTSPYSSGSNAIAVFIGVDTGLSLAILNFFIKSFVYLAWCMKVLYFVCLIWIPKKMVSSPIMEI